MDSIKENINTIITEIFGAEKLQVVLASTELQKNMDSLNFIQLLVRIERAFNIEIDENYLNLHSFKSIDDLYNYVNKLVNMN